MVEGTSASGDIANRSSAGKSRAEYGAGCSGYWTNDDGKKLKRYGLSIEEVDMYREILKEWRKSLSISETFWQ